jgi:hypothetical protein
MRGSFMKKLMIGFLLIFLSPNLFAETGKIELGFLQQGYEPSDGVKFVLDDSAKKLCVTELRNETCYGLSNPTAKDIEELKRFVRLLKVADEMAEEVVEWDPKMAKASSVEEYRLKAHALTAKIEAAAEIKEFKANVDKISEPINPPTVAAENAQESSSLSGYDLSIFGIHVYTWLSRTPGSDEPQSNNGIKN